MEEQPHASGRVRVLTENGLHMRPAQLVVRAMTQFHSEVSLALGEHRIDAKSIFDVISLAAEQGTELTVEARGDDAAEAVEALVKLFESDFEADADGSDASAP